MYLNVIELPMRCRMQYSTVFSTCIFSLVSCSDAWKDGELNMTGHARRERAAAAALRAAEEKAAAREHVDPLN